MQPMDNPAVSQVVEVTEIPSFNASAIRPAPTGTHNLVPALLRKLSRAVICAILIIAPLLFGAVHTSVFSAISGTIFLLFSAYCFASADAFKFAFSHHQNFRFTLYCLLALFVYVIAQSALLSFSSLSDYPLVSGHASKLADVDGALTWISSLAAFIALFTISTTYFSIHPGFIRTLKFLLCAVALMVSLIALGHWYYDNGKLFGIFAPESIFVSDRARWPFVNSNHLGNFLLPLIMLAVGQFTDLAREILGELAAKRRPLRATLSAMSSASHFQRRLAQLGFFAVSALTSVVAVIASLSRATWIGLCVALCLFVVLQYLFAPASPITPPMRESRRHRPSHSERRDSQWLLKCRAWGPPLLLTLAFGLLVIFLNQRGGELFLDRLDYGLMYTKDDIRWQLYTDSIPLIFAHPFFGVGIAAWAQYYPQLMHPLLGGINPVYLHSDPLQALIELGVIGVLPLVVLSIGLSSKVLARVRTKTKSCALSALYCGCIGVLIGASFDFPLHIPAITFYFAIYLALICCLSSESFAQHGVSGTGPSNSTETFPN